MLWANGMLQGWAKTRRQNFTEDAVEAGEEGDGAIGCSGSDGGGARLEERGDGAGDKAGGSCAKGADGGEKAGQERCPTAVPHLP